ncbi:MAG: DNA-processing protein DprA, partial [Desulfovibrio sp.]|nr:DNA-processing protein DprA [Desulfovibrio sp.]
MSISDDNDNRDAKRSAAPLRDFGEEERKEFWAILALKYCKGAGVRTIARLLKVYGGAYNSVENYAVWTKAGIPATLAAEFSSGKWRRAARAEWDSAMKLNASILLWTSEAYPELLRQLPDAPGYLYCEGDLNLLSPASVAIVGSRNASTEGRRIAELLGRELAAAGVTVISGMASGIDACAHEGALREIGGSVGVLGTGIDLEYPPVNKKLFAKMRQRGLLLSEFSPGFPPINYNFPIRNRIISGLSLGVVVVEAAEKSGSLVTARLALEQNREVLAVPGTPFDDHSKGCQN